MKRYQLSAKSWIWMLLIGALLLTFFATQEKLVKANLNIEFTKSHAGKYVAMSGRKWIIIDVIDGKPYLMMDSIYAKRPWNSSGDNSDASKIFQFLQDEFHNIITVAEDRDLIAETTWEIRSMDFYNIYNEYMTAGGKTISPTSLTQKLGLISRKEVLGDTNYCDTIVPVLSDEYIWTRTPDYEYSEHVFSIGKTGSACFYSGEYANASSIGIQPVLYLKDTVRIQGGSGTESNPYVLTKSNAPNVVDIEADGTTNIVTVKNVPANTTVKVYDANGTTQIGSKTNGNSVDTVNIEVNTDLRWNNTIHVTFTQISKAESNQVAATVFDNAPPNISLSASPTTLTNHKVTVTATITDKASDIEAKKWALGEKDAPYFSNSGQNITGATFEVNENGVYTVYAKDVAGNDAVEQITINNIDRTPPTLANVTIQSSNANTNWAKVGDEITLAFTASKQLEISQSMAKIAGHAVSIQNTSSLNYRATYTMKETDDEGIVNFSIDYRDSAGNVGTSVTSTTDNSEVTFDKTAPTIQFTMTGNENYAKTAASIVTVSDSGSGVAEGTLEYVWTNSESMPESGWQPFSNGSRLKLEDENGKWYLHILAKDKASNESYARTNAFALDNKAPEINFGTNGNSTPAKVAESKVTVTDAGSGIDEVTLEYVWKDSASEPTDGWQPFTNESELKLEDEHVNGKWYLHVRVFDIVGNEGYATSNVFVLDNTGPIITLNGDHSIELEAGSAFIDPGATAIDNIDGDLTNSIITTGTVDVQIPKTYTIIYEVADTAGNKATATRTVKVVPAVPPVIEFIPNGDMIPNKLAKSKVIVTDDGSDIDENSLQYVWSDKLSKPENGWQSFHNGEELQLDDLTASGNWYLHVRAKDKGGNESYNVSNAFVLDNLAPVISLIGSNPLYIPHESDFIEPGAIAIDNIDGDISNSIVVTGTMDTITLGHYQRYYSVSDRAGNSTTVTRDVIVFDGSAPIIYLEGSNPMFVEVGSLFTDPGATAVDKQDGDLTAFIVVTGTVDPTTVGEYVLTYNVSDSTGNQAPTVTRTVYVQDTKPPILKLLGETEITLPYGAAFEDPGAQAIDDYYGDISHLIEVIGTVDTMKVGTYTLRYHVQDPSGNKAEEQIRIVYVEENASLPSPGGGGSSGSDESSSRESQSRFFIDANGSLLNPSELDTSKKLVTIQLRKDDATNIVYLHLPVSILTDFAHKNPNLQLEIEAPFGSYLLPVTLPSLIFGWEEMLQENDWEAVQVSFKLTLVDRTEEVAIHKALLEQFPSSESISPIVDFYVSLVDVETEKTLTEIKHFTQPLIRQVFLSEEIDPKSKLWGAFRYDETNGEFTFVPARLEQRNGKTFAVIRSYSNSIYLVAKNDVSFTDTEQHWGKDDVALAAAKGLVRGRGEGKYAPNDSVSRAEFAAMLIRALGRSDSSHSELRYVDVQRGAWYMKEAALATELGLFDFIQDNYLRPNQPLTREEMASMLAAVIRSEKVLPEKLATLDGYKDKASVDEAFLDDVQLMMALGIMTGTGSDEFSSKGETTRAQAAAVLLRTLRELEWID